MKTLTCRKHVFLLLAVLVLCLLCAAAQAAAYPESAHPYLANTDISTPYVHPTAADSLEVTFSSDTEVESSYDKIIIRDSQNVDHTYTGTMLQGQTITLPGNSFTIRLTSDGSVQKYGYTITSITAIGGDENILTGTCGTSISWTLDKTTGLLTLTGSGAMPNYTYVYEPGGKYDDTISEYSHPWDECLSLITSIKVGEGITTLGNYAFGGMSKVTSISLPSTLTAIGNNAFKSHKYTTIDLPDSITSIGTEAFENVVLQSIDLPVSLQTIGDYAFYSCPFTSVTLPQSVTGIGRYAFYKTTATSVTLPESLVSLDSTSFPAGVALTFPDTIPNGQTGDLTWDVIGDTLTIRGTGAMADYSWVSSDEAADYSTAPWWDYQSSIDRVVVTSGVTTIGQNAFRGITLTSVSLPSTLTTINNKAFFATSLPSITVPSSVTTVDNAFSSATAVTGMFAGGVSDDTVWHIKSGKLTVSGSIPDYAYYTYEYDQDHANTPWHSYVYSITSIEIEDGISYIGNNAFNGCLAATTVIIPDSVTTIGTDAFENCNAITTVDYGDYNTTSSAWPRITFRNVYSNPMAYSGKAKLYLDGYELTYVSALQADVTDYAFYNCKNTFGVAASGGKLTTVGNCAFYGCTGLYEASLPTSVTHVGNSAFYGCTSLSSVYMLFDGLTYIGNNAFYNCTSLTNVDMRYNVDNAITFMGTSAFNNCTSLKSVDMGRITALPEDTFRSCTALTTVTLPDGMESIGNSAFYNCSSLSSIKLPDSVTTIGSEAFYRNTSLIDFDMPQNLTTIGSFAFSYCGLTDITLPETVAQLGNYAFQNCVSLKNITFLGTAPVLDGNFPFYGVTADVSYRTGSSWRSLINFGTSLTWIPWGGACGDAYWTITEQGLLNITGTGTVQAGEWAQYADDIDQIFISSGITAIGDNAFTGLPNVQRISFEGTVTDIADTAFSGITADVYWKLAESAMLEMCEGFETPYQKGFGGTLDWNHPVCSATVSNYALMNNAHAPVANPAAEATCTEDGHIDYWQCSQCSLCFADAEALQYAAAETLVIPALGHSYQEAFVWADDGSACAVNFTCAACNDVQTLEATVTAEEAKAPECLIPGDTLYTAAVVFGTEQIPDPQQPDAFITVDKQYTETLLLSDIPALGHTEETIAGFTPTCTEPGTKDYIFCIVCGADIQLDEELPALGHTEAVTLEALAPTCTEAGRTEEISCTVCFEVLTPSEIIEATGHTEYVSKAAVAPTCEENGLTEEISCEVCGKVVAEVTEVPFLGHTEVIDAAVPPTCEDTGLTEGTHCEVCGEVVLAQETVPALGHTPEVDAAVPPTDRETGLTEGAHCGVCGETLTAQETVPANFTWDGETTVIAYNGTAADVVIPEGVTALGTTLFKNNTAISTVHVPASVTSIGTQCFFGCTSLTDVWLPANLTSISAQTFYNVTARLHAAADSSTAIALSRYTAFTTDEGFTLRYKLTSSTPTEVWFIACHNSAETIVLPAAINNLPVTQIGAGAFAGCSALRQIQIPANVKTIAADAFAADTDLTILSAADAYARTWADSNGFLWAHDHHEEAVKAGYAPTCEEPGLSDSRWCTGCGEVLSVQEVMPALGHTEVPTPAVEPTCEDTGLTEGTHCELCGKVFTAQETVPALGHVEIFTEAVPATHITTGLTAGSYCGICGETVTGQEIIPVVEVKKLVLPAVLTEIEEEAFAYNNAFECMVIPESCRTIGCEAFAFCTELRFAEIPATVETIHPSAFTGCNENLIIVTAEGSAAEAYALQHGITCVLVK